MKYIIRMILLVVAMVLSLPLLIFLYLVALYEWSNEPAEVVESISDMIVETFVKIK